MQKMNKQETIILKTGTEIKKIAPPTENEIRAYVKANSAGSFSLVKFANWVLKREDENGSKIK